MEHFIEKLNEIEKTHRELEEKLSDPAVIADQTNYKRLAKTRHQLQQTVDTYRDWQAVQTHLSGAQEILRTESDKDIREMAEQEIEDLRRRELSLSEQLRVLLLPKDPNDEK